MKPLSSLLAVALLSVPALGHASGNGSGQPGAQFLTEWDVSGTGSVTLVDMQTRRGEIFEMFDLNGDGTIDSPEAENMAQTVAGQEENNGKGQHGQGQGRNAFAPGRVIHDAMTVAFNDADADGLITKDEFVTSTERAFAQLDRNSDGSLTLADFGR